MSHKFALGSRLKSRVSGFVGIAVGRIEYLNGCVQYCLKPPVDKEGKNVEPLYFDVEELELVNAGVADTVKPSRSGGPTPVGTPTSRALS